MSHTITAQDFTTEELIQALKDRGVFSRAPDTKGHPVVRITYDPTVDAAYIYLRPKTEKPSRRVTRMLCGGSNSDVVIDVDRERGEIMGMEVLAATSNLSEALLATASAEDT
jgi:uncharacterized protein YuzE